MLKLVVYKKKACIYLIGGMKEPICTLSKESNFAYILGRLSFILIGYFWDVYSGIEYKGKFYGMKTREETAKFIEERLKEN